MACVTCPADCSANVILPAVGNDCAIFDDAEMSGIFISSEVLPSVSADTSYTPGDDSVTLATFSADLLARLDNADILTSDKVRHVCIEGAIPTPEREELRACKGYVNGKPTFTFDMKVSDLSPESVQFWQYLDNCNLPIYFYVYTDSTLYGENKGATACMESFKGYVSFNEEVTEGRAFNSATLTIKVDADGGLARAYTKQIDGINLF